MITHVTPIAHASRSHASIPAHGVKGSPSTYCGAAASCSCSKNKAALKEGTPVPSRCNRSCEVAGRKGTAGFLGAAEAWAEVGRRASVAAGLPGLDQVPGPRTAGSVAAGRAEVEREGRRDGDEPGGIPWPCFDGGAGRKAP